MDTESLARLAQPRDFPVPVVAARQGRLDALALARLHGEDEGGVGAAAEAAPELNGEAHTAGDGLEAEAPLGGGVGLDRCVVADQPPEDDAFLVRSSCLLLRRYSFLLLKTNWHSGQC